MNDLISRQAAIEAIRAEKIIITPELKPHYDSLGMTSRAADYNAACDKNIALLKLLPPAQRWIPVSERLPEMTGIYLITNSVTGYDQMEVAFFENGQWGTRRRGIPIAWMPLPEPYEEVE